MKKGEELFNFPSNKKAVLGCPFEWVALFIVLFYLIKLVTLCLMIEFRSSKVNDYPTKTGLAAQ